MELVQELEEYRAKAEASVPATAVALVNTGIEALNASFDFDGVPGIDDTAPDFSLPDTLGKSLSLRERLKGGPVVLTFYHGAWCPYCNIQLAAYQRALSDITDAGGQLVAISPQMPDDWLAVVEKNALTFDVLSDADNLVARSFGLIYRPRRDFRIAMKAINIHLPDIDDGDDSELPMPATFVIGRNGRITLTFVEADFRKRPPPKTIIEALDAASRNAA